MEHEMHLEPPNAVRSALIIRRFGTLLRRMTRHHTGFAEALLAEQHPAMLAEQATKVHDELHPELLRGARAAVLLRRFGRLLRNDDVLKRHSQGKSGLASKMEATAANELYALSVPVDRLPLFISHSWVTPRGLKFLALSFYFRSAKALALCASVSIGSCIAQLLGWRPPGLLAPRVQMGSAVATVFMSSVSFWCATTTLFLVSFFGIGTRFGTDNTICFFDKVCIHQADAERKRAGILSLGGFVARSERMLILWSHRYFTRLWCVFELACHCAVHGGTGSVTVLPVSFAVLFLISQFMCKVATTPSYLFVWLKASPETPPYVLMAVSGIAWLLQFPWVLGYYCAYHYRMQDALALRQQLSSFSCRDAECFDPADKRLVLSCIEGWFGSCEAFDAFVRDSLAPALMRQHGRLVPAMPLWVVSAVCVTYMLEFLDSVAYNAHDPHRLAENFLRQVPGFLLQMSCINYGYSLLVLQLARWGERSLESARGRLLAVATFAGLGVMTVSLYIIPLPLHWEARLPLAVRYAYALLLLAALWWHELGPTRANAGTSGDPSKAAPLTLAICVVAAALLGVGQLVVQCLPTCPAALKWLSPEVGITCGMDSALKVLNPPHP